MASEVDVGSNGYRERPTSASLSPTKARRPPGSFVDIKALEYTGPVNPNLVCPICRCPFLSPRRLRCDHIFCADCLNQSMLDEYANSTCPSCRQQIYPLMPDAIQPVSRIIIHILDDLTVKCPSMSDGCQTELARGTVRDHIMNYCSYADVVCPAENCDLVVARKDFAQGRCLHSKVHCPDCQQSLLERDLENHRNHDCRLVHLSCQYCGLETLRTEQVEHLKECPEVTFACEAAPYGCDFRAKRSDFETHLKICPLAKLVPFLELQNDRLEAQKEALDHLTAKNNILQTAVSNVIESLESQPDSIDRRASTIVDVSTTHHLLCVHESLRRDVERVSMELSHLDAKASMMILNESLRAKDEMAHTNAAVNGIRTQLHWLTMANQQRTVPTRAHPPSQRTQTNSSVVTGGSVAVQSPQPTRRLSDPSRQETKL